MEDYKDKKVTCRMVTGETKEVLVTELTFRPSVYGVIVKDGKVLLVPQWDGYDFPGGGVHEGEPILEALVREVKEETGIDVVPGNLLHVMDDFFIHPRTGKPFHSILMFYTCEVVGGEISDTGFTEFERSIAKLAEWVDIEKARTVRFYNPVNSPELIQKATV